MKRKVQNLKQQKIYIRRRVALVVVLIALLALIVAINASTSENKKTADKNNILNNVDLSNVISEDPNPPVVGAGMIPIKWNGTNWVITTEKDGDWYDYSSGKWAYIMLSDRKIFI